MSLNSLRLPNPSTQAQIRAGRLLEDLQRRFQKRELLSHDDVRGAVYEALQQFFLHAAEPLFVGATLPAHLPRDRQRYLEPLRAIANDVAVVYAESQSLTTALSASFNLQMALMQALKGRLLRAGSTLIDLQISQGAFNQAVIVAGDDFSDDSRIDTAITLSLPRADIQPLAGLLTLRRTGNETAIDPTLTTIRIETLQDYRYRPYEGQFFGLAGQAVPEGGSFHLIERPIGQAIRESLPNDLLRRFREYTHTFVAGGGKLSTQVLSAGLVQARSQGSFAGFSSTEWELIGGQIHTGTELDTLLGGEIPEFQMALDPSKALIEQGASVAERAQARLAMVDGNPDSFWQIEYTRAISTGSAELRDGDANYPERVGLLSTLLQQQLRDFDALDFDIRITIDLGREVVVNWVDMVPMLFDGAEHLEILAAESSQDGATFTALPTLRAGPSGNQLAADTNKTLEASTVSATLAPSDSAFAGSGLWVFAPRALRYLRFDLRQPVPVLTPYQVLAVQLSRTVRRRHSRNSVGRRRPSTQDTETRTVVLSYPETLQITNGGADPADQVGAQGAQRIEAEGALNTLLEGGGVNVSNLNKAVRDLVGTVAGRPTRGRTLIGNENIDRQWVETRWDRQRYAIAIRDIGAWRYQFVEQSEFVSVGYQSPEPIRDVSLEVDESIPKPFTDQRAVASFIDYYIGFGDSQEWIPLAPVTSRVLRTLEGNRLPSVVHVNSGVPPDERAPGDGYADFDHEVTQIRLRAVLRRLPDGEIPEANNYTPALKSYRLRWTVRGGFR